jgi:hypothetical protein
MAFIKCHVLSLTKFNEKVGNRNKPAPHIEVALVLDDVTRFSPTIKKRTGTNTWNLTMIREI